MYLLDTNHCSRIVEGDVQVLARMRQLGTAPVSTSFITRGELLYMCHNSDRREENIARISAFLDGIHLYLVDLETIEEYARLKAALVKHFGPREKAKRRTATTRDLGFDDNDLWIAAVALRHSLTVVSADTDFTRIREVSPLSLESWWSPA